MPRPLEPGASPVSPGTPQIPANNQTSTDQKPTNSTFNSTFHRKVSQTDQQSPADFEAARVPGKVSFKKLFLRQCKKLQATLATPIIQLLIWIDEKIVHFRHKGANREVHPGRFQPTRQTRQTVMPDLIPENKTFGCFYPEGVPSELLKQYTNPRLVVVHQGDVNQYGHALMAFGKPDDCTDHYVHVNSANWYPEHLDGDAFAQYLQHKECQIAYEIAIDCNDPQAMQEKINELSQQKWLWKGPVHNCLTFCKEVSTAATGKDIFGEQMTVSNRLANAAMRGVKACIHQTKENMPAIINTTRFLHHKKALDLLKQLDEFDLNSLIHYKIDEHAGTFSEEHFLATVLDAIETIVKQSSLPKKIQKRLLQYIKAELPPLIQTHLEQSAKEIIANHLRDLGDLPIATAYNVNPEKRIVGPQSLAGFMDEEGL